MRSQLQADRAEHANRSYAVAVAGSVGERFEIHEAWDIPEDAVIVIPVRNIVLFPGLIMSIAIGRDSSISAAQEADRNDRKIGFLLRCDPDADLPATDDLHLVGTIGRILRYVVTPGGSHHVVCQGEQRFRVIEFLEGYPFYVARVACLTDYEEASIEIEARMARLKERVAEILDLLPQAQESLADTAQDICSPAALTDFVAGLIDLSAVAKQELLETFDLRQRLEKILELVTHRIEVLRLSRDIDAQTQERVGARQRQALLREQLQTIRAALGEEGGAEAESAELEAAIAAACMPEEVTQHARKELRRLDRLPEAAVEYSMVHTYLEWLTELPWSVATDDRMDIVEARRILDEHHYGLPKVKRRILEHLAVRKLNPKGSSPILCFIGPPGVGKTSLGQSIAKAMGRKFVRVSLGGVHDVAEIRGHRRTYIGALPGNVMQAIRKAGSSNCVMMLDELDKLGSDVRGDPSAGLLEVLDPEQNVGFRDNYLAVPFDLSKVMFICTANMPDSIPAALRDRMEMIELPGYTEEEKLQIARAYLVRRQLEASGLAPAQCGISDAALRGVIRRYTREAGVRGLEREIGCTFRHAAMLIGEGSAERVTIDECNLETILGAPKFENEFAMRTSLPGVATGLMWTPAGGGILFIEASRAPGHGKLILTGQLGDVMKESAMTALTLLKSHSPHLGIDAELFDKCDIHVHVPAGAIPKDGPSAGVAMFIALASLILDRPVRSDRAMTGEISLRGLVLPVGGIKDKVLGALRAGIETILLPRRNLKDLAEIPEHARCRAQFIWLDTIQDAVDAALMEHAHPQVQAIA